MDFKKLFRKDEKAVSPVIGVILMVAITVILAAAIGSSVFSKGTAEAAPQANLNIKAVNITEDNKVWVKIEHLGGESIHFEDSSKTKISASLNGNTSVNITTSTGLGTMGVGDVRALELKDKDGNKFGTEPGPILGDTVNIKIIDVQTNQLICDKNIRI